MARPKGPFQKGWKYKDPFDHVRHTGFLRMRAQCRFRGEPFELSIEDFFNFWTEEFWPKRGLKAEDLVLIRIDPEGAWSKDNCKIVTRYQQLCRGKKMHRFKGLEDV